MQELHLYESRALELITEIFQSWGIRSDCKSSITQEEGEEVVSVRINVPNEDDRAHVIGYRGNTLNSLQTYVKSVLQHELGDWIMISLDVNGYRDERIEKLHDLATRQAERARFLQTDVALPPMNSQDRRELHIAVKDMEGVHSVSQGAGRNRFVVIRPGDAPLEEVDGMDAIDFSKMASSEEPTPEATAPVEES